MTRYDKLVRDLIPQYITSQGGQSVTHIADDEEYWQKLKAKLQEEVDEFVESETPDELADILEVVDAICQFKRFQRSEVEELQRAKREQRGGFAKKIILEES